MRDEGTAEMLYIAHHYSQAADESAACDFLQESIAELSRPILSGSDVTIIKTAGATTCCEVAGNPTHFNPCGNYPLTKLTNISDAVPYPNL